MIDRFWIRWLGREKRIKIKKNKRRRGRDALQKIFELSNPGAVVHAGGVCDLDLCQDRPDFAYEVNVVGARNIRELAMDKYVLYVSSDLVFSGNNPPPGGYEINSTPDPVSVVGETYVAAEKEIIRHSPCAVVRVGLPMGSSISGKKGVVDFIAERLRKKLKMTLFYDEIRSLVSTQDLAEGILRFFQLRTEGLFHFAAQKSYSLYDIGKHLVDTRRYDSQYLISSSRFDEKNGPPRIGDVTLNSSDFYDEVGFIPSSVFVQ